MKARLLPILAGVILGVGLMMSACSNGDDDDGGGDDDSVACHELGVPFAAPEGVIDPWRAVDSNTCCEGAFGIAIAEEMSTDECVPLEPLQFVCTEDNGDGDCDEHENFCTSPIDCPPPEGFAETCCQEGDFCWRSGYSELPPSGVLGCCTGLEEIEMGYWDENLQECYGFFDESTVVCVLDCGDGVCTAGENPCNCAEDCPTDEW